MIKEAYCSYEISKLLKEKGFDEPCKCLYENNGERYTLASTCYQNVCDEGEYLCPTHQMAMAWLRKKGFYIEIQINLTLNDEIYYKSYIYTSEEDWSKFNDWVKSYEESVEAALKYVLEKLI